MAQSAEALRPLAGPEGQRLVVELPDDPVPLVADGERIRQVLHNLLGNALKFSRPEGTVRVALEATPQEAVVSVSDEGIGIEPHRPYPPTERDAPSRHHGVPLGMTDVRLGRSPGCVFTAVAEDTADP